MYNLPFRQLEAIIRISESLAKMRLLPFATAAHVEEALRLFQVSTLDAAMSGSLSGKNNYYLIYKALTAMYLHVDLISLCGFMIMKVKVQYVRQS